MRIPDTWWILPNPNINLPSSGKRLINFPLLPESNSESLKSLLVLSKIKVSNPTELSFRTIKLIDEGLDSF